LKFTRASPQILAAITEPREKRVFQKLKAALVGAFLALACIPASYAQPADVAQTQHSIRVGGKEIKYTAYAGRLPIRDQATGESHGEMFFAAYRVVSNTPRPAAFIWNGGPGANSMLLHFEAFGPRTFENGKLTDNQQTLLSSADLVFVDPIGTGFSRATSRDYLPEFYNTLGDHQSVAEFIRVWRLAFDAQTAPIFMIGESFGTWRAAGVAEILAKRGQHVSGIVLISGGAGVGLSYNTRPERAGYRIPGRAATALYHGKLDPKLGKDRDTVMRAAREWAATTYTPALARLASLSEAERSSIARDLALYTGLSEGAINRDKLELAPREYLAALLKDQGKALNTFDMRITGGEGADVSPQRIDAYFREDLGYKTDLAYAGLGGGLGQAYTPTDAKPTNINGMWNYNSGEITPEVMAAAQAGEGPPGSQPWAVNAIKADPKLKVMVAAGIYDSLNNCAENDALLRKLEPGVAANFVIKCYAGGHMMYRDAAEGVRLSNDIRAFIAGAR
jgi:carboxypeptidase C (cathepsin A)